MSPSRASSIIRPLLEVLIVLFFLGMLYTWASKDSDTYEDNLFEVTITYDCEKVLHDRNYPSEVISECLDLRDEIKRRNNK